MNLGAEVRPVAQLVKCLPSMHKVLGSVLYTGQTVWSGSRDPSTRDRRVNQKFEVILGYIGSLIPVWAT